MSISARPRRGKARSTSVFRSMVLLGTIASIALVATTCSATTSSRTRTDPPADPPSSASPAPTAGPTASAPRGSAPASPEPSTTEPPAPPTSGNPFLERDLYVPRGRAAMAAEAAPAGPDRDILTRLAEVPTAVWLTPEEMPPQRVGQQVSRILAEASTREQVAVLVVYGIPERDCIAGHSRGGLEAEDYLAWVGEIADAANDSAVFILEPDALVSAPECDLVDERTSLLAEAGLLLSARSATYLDAGHSDWLDVPTTVGLLQQAGVTQLHGFSIGVAGYGHVDTEKAYAQQVAAQLSGAAYVIDTSRSGNGAVDDWCNPPWRALGPEPTAVDDGTWLDALLWVKPPGESDGPCHGGPPAGKFWPERALELARTAGW